MKYVKKFAVGFLQVVCRLKTFELKRSMAKEPIRRGLAIRNSDVNYTTAEI
jgi:hypothetical protein